MRAFLITVIVALVLLGVGFWYARQNPEELPEEIRDTMEVGQDIRAEARGPQDYHILQDQGGIPRAEAERAGLVSGDYAYLAALTAVGLNEDDGVEQEQSLRVSGKLYDLGFKFNSRPPELQTLEYNLQGEWDTLSFGFGFTDDEASDPSGRLAIELSVQGDGRDIMGPMRITPNDLPYFAELDVSGVRRVMFVVRRIGGRNHFAPVLLDPFVKKAPASEASE